MAVIPKRGELDPGCYVGICDCGTVVKTQDGDCTYNITIQAVAYPGQGKITTPGMADCPFLRNARLAVDWLFREDSPFLRSGSKMTIPGNHRNMYDFSFFMEPPGLEVFGFHLSPTYCLAAVAMATGWEVDEQVRNPRLRFILWLALHLSDPT